MNNLNKTPKHLNYPNINTLLIHEKGLLKNGFFFIEENKKYLFVIDENVYKLHQNIFVNLSNNVIIYLFNACEENKSFEEYNNILNTLFENDFSKNDYIVSIGGGITSDLSLFVSSTYQRGMNIVLIPTTLLSMVDASIGGKCGINYQGFKNQVGSFYFPNMIIIDDEFLDTLSETQFKCGFSEIIKYGLLFDEEMIYSIENKSYFLEVLIDKCIDHKMNTIKDDFYDNSKRKLLNFGHTYGHILESAYNYSLSHGHAVAIGMYKEIKDKELREKVYNLLKEYFDLDYKLDEETIKKYITKDKKRNSNTVDVVLLEKIGKARIITKKVEEIVNEYIW